MGDRKGSPLLYDESARQACGEACTSPGWCGQSLSAYGRRKRPHPTQLFPRPYGFEGSSEGMSYHTYPCKSTTAPTRKRGFFLLNLTPLGRNSLRPYICSSLSVYFGMAHGKVGAASCSKQKIQIFTRCLYRGGSRLCAVYVLSATLSPEARSTVHSS